MTPILCTLIGHKWLWKNERDHVQDGKLWTHTKFVPLTHCIRCGSPNPQFAKQDRAIEAAKEAK